MLKKVLGSTDLLIDINRKFYDNYERPINIPVSKDKVVQIQMFNKGVKINLEKLFLLSWFEVHSIQDIESQLDNIVFHKASPTIRVTTGYVMGFKEPIIYKSNFRYIPSYPRYAINIESDVLDTVTNKIVTNREIHDGYECVYIRSPDKSKNYNIRVHRLMCLAFLPNDDFINKPIVNHIDGNKVNNKLENLEWCSYIHNSNHALDTGLTNTRIMMKTRDRFTGKVEIYNSVVELAKIMSYAGRSSVDFENKLPGYLYKGRYEIKKFEDDTPWFYENSNDSFTNKRSIYTINVVDKASGEVSIFNSVDTFLRHYNLKGCKTGNSLEEGIALLKERNPNLVVSYVRNAIRGPYYLHDIIEKKTIVFEAMSEVAEYTGIGLNELKLDASRKLKYIYCKKWIVNWARTYDLSEYTEKEKRVNKVLIIDTNNGTERIAGSMKEAARLVGLEFRTIQFRVKTEEPYKGLIFKLLKE